MVPDELRGRVMAVHVMMFMGMAPFGSFLAGAVAERLERAGDGCDGRCLLPGGALLFMIRLPKLQMTSRIPMQARMD